MLRAKNVFVIKPGEQEKSLDVARKLWQRLLDAKADRKSLLVNVGGGVVTDLGGFVASTFMRGMPFVNVPTSLLAQVDAGIGGKTGINFAGVKNIIGTITQPRKVIINTQCLQTLPKRQLRAGFAEIIKYGLVNDKTLFRQASSKHPEEFTQKQMERIIAKSVQIKLRIAGKDPLDMGTRRILNFGHTIGHAIETTTKLNHGEAVAVGMRAEAYLSHLKGFLSGRDVCFIEEALKKVNLPIAAHVKTSPVWKCMRADKKNSNGILRFVLLKSIGKAVFDQTATKDQVNKALDYVEDR